MLISELLSESYSPRQLGYQMVSDDHSLPDWDGVRRSRLTLKQIRRLRQMNDCREAERLKKAAFLRDIYRYIPPKGL